MAKRKTTRKKKQEPVEDYQRSSFWPLAGAILMFLLAVFVLLGGFGTGGPLPTTLFDGAYWALGWAAYLVPVALVYFGMAKFMTHDRRIPLPALVSMLAFIIMMSSWFQVGFGSYNELANDWDTDQGGQVGMLFGTLALGALDKLPAAIMFLSLIHI